VFNAETLIVGFTAGALGVLITLLLTIPANAIIKAVSGVSGIAALPLSGAIILVALSMGLTLVSGLIPSRIAAKKDPVVALRTE
jgi:putative ABC transport system permease protein